MDDMLEFCPICGSVLIPTSFDRRGEIIAAGIGCPDKHYAKVTGGGVLTEMVDGEWFSCHFTASLKVKQGWQFLINKAVFKACRKYRAGINRLPAR
jgi:hypothetical protein